MKFKPNDWKYIAILTIILLIGIGVYGFVDEKIRVHDVELTKNVTLNIANYQYQTGNIVLPVNGTNIQFIDIKTICTGAEQL